MTHDEEKLFKLRLGKAIASARLSQELTQEQVAAAIGVEPVTISRLERGTSVPSLQRLLDIAELLKTPVGTLLQGSSQQPLDVAQTMASQLEVLSSEDRVWIQSWVQEMCLRLHRRKRGK